MNLKKYYNHRNIFGKLSFINVRMKGQITVFASLVIVLVISVVCASIRSVAMSVAKTNANAALNLSIESVFAEYSRIILDEYDVLFLKKTDQLESNLKNYIDRNTKYSTGFTSEKLDKVDINEIILATDKGGIPIKTEILDYMKYGVFSEALQLILGSEDQLRKSEITKNIVDKIGDCENQTSQLDRIVLQLISIIEGIDTDENGFNIRNHKPVAKQGDFVKMICIGEVSPTNVGVYHSQVYNVLEKKYSNVIEILLDMKLNAEDIIELGEEESELSGINSYNSIFLRDYNNLSILINGVIEKTKEAIKAAEEYESAFNKVVYSVENIESQMKSDKSILGNELVESFSQDLTELKNHNQTQLKKIYNIEIVLESLKSNAEILNNTKEILDSLNKELNIENAHEILIEVEELVDTISKLDNSGLVFDYTSVDFSSKTEGLGVIKNISKTMKEGVVGLVVEDVSKISKKITEYKDLSSSHNNNSSNYEASVTQRAKENVIYNEYLISKFKSYTDSFDPDRNRIDSESILDYPLEYILCGNGSDYENIKSTISKLLLMREGANLSYLITDNLKKSQCYGLSLSLLGFCGNYGVIKAGQYLIMAVWAYGEGILDARKLLNGEKIEVIKNQENWQLSLENLLTMDFTTNSAQKKSDKGLNYEDYIRMLLFTGNQDDKYFRTMDSMELKMIEKGYADFRFKNYIYSLKGKAVFSINGKPNFYSQEIKYSY